MTHIRILVADDEQEICSMIGRWFAKEPWQMVFAKNGYEALALLCDQHFEVAILDVRMPKMDGLTTLEMARQKGIQTPVVFLTGYGTIELSVQAMRLGAWDFLTKPIQRSKLISTVQNLLDCHLLPPHALAERLDAYIKDFSTVSSLHLKDVCKQFKISPSYASRLFRMYVGVSFRERLAFYRVQKAKKLIADTDDPLKMVAGMCGFKQRTRLTEAFRRLMGVAPQTFRHNCIARRTD